LKKSDDTQRRYSALQAQEQQAGSDARSSGRPFWARKDEGAWSMPKGLFEEHESSLDAARREFREETGFDVEGEFIPLGVLRQPSRR